MDQEEPKVISRTDTLKKRIHEIPKVAVGLSLAVVIAIVMTLISLEIYVLSGTSSLDASLPGSELTRKNLQRTPDTSDKNFSSTGKLDAQSYDTFLKLYDQRTKDLQDVGDFTDASLQNPNIGLIPQQ